MSRYPKKPAAPKKGAGKKKAAPAKAKPKAKKAAAKKVTPKTKARTMRVRKTTALGKSESGVQVEGWDHFERHADRTHADTERVIEGLAASSVSSVNFGATLTEAPVKPPSAWHRFRCAITGLFGERAD